MEEIRIRAVERVQAGESPEIVIRILEFALWTRSIVADLIKRQFGIMFSLTSVGRLLRQLGFSSQKPLYRAFQRDPELVKQWKNQIFPQIQKRVKKEKAVIYFQDESGIRSDFHSGITWALKGRTPIIEATGARFGRNMMGAITPRGQMQFMIVQGTVKSDQICAFWKRLMHGHGHKVFLIGDGHPTRKSKKVKECVDSFEGRLETFLLPSYSPDLNPIKQLWNHAKGNVVGRQVISDPDQLKSAVINFPFRSSHMLYERLRNSNFDDQG